MDSLLFYAKPWEKPFPSYSSRTTSTVNSKVYRQIDGRSAEDVAHVICSKQPIANLTPLPNNIFGFRIVVIEGTGHSSETPIEADFLIHFFRRHFPRLENLHLKNLTILQSQRIPRQLPVASMALKSMILENLAPANDFGILHFLQHFTWIKKFVVLSAGTPTLPIIGTAAMAPAADLDSFVEANFASDCPKVQEAVIQDTAYSRLIQTVLRRSGTAPTLRSLRLTISRSVEMIFLLRLLVMVAPGLTDLALEFSFVKELSMDSVVIEDLQGSLKIHTGVLALLIHNMSCLSTLAMAVPAHCYRGQEKDPHQAVCHGLNQEGWAFLVAVIQDLNTTVKRLSIEWIFNDCHDRDTSLQMLLPAYFWTQDNASLTNALYAVVTRDVDPLHDIRLGAHREFGPLQTPPDPYYTEVAEDQKSSLIWTFLHNDCKIPAIGDKALQIMDYIRWVNGME